MNFHDQEKSNVQSLLALLRSTQDDPSSSSSTSAQPSAVTNPPNQPKSPAKGVPSQKQLNDLLHSLNKKPQPTPAPPTPPEQRANRNLIAPFGPITTATTAARDQKLSRTGSGTLDALRKETREESQGLTDGSIAKDWNIKSFKDCLPILAGLIAQPDFMFELKKMKADQDALERRLWAKQEKVKSEHERTIQAEKDIARIAQRPIPPEKRAQWAVDLELNLSDFYRHTVIPSFDSLALRHRQKLQSLGVPGLGGEKEDKLTVDRWRRIMDLLQAGMEEQ